MENNFDYKKLCPFKWFVLQNFPFIDADFDAITNYQLFCKLGEEINKIINSTNELGEQVEELTNAFNNLKDYVDNYFSELNVQEQIDNKLDEMADDGTLAEIINQEIFGELNNKIQSAENDIDAIETRLTTDETSITNLQTKTQNIENSLTPASKIRDSIKYTYKKLIKPIFKQAFAFCDIQTDGEKYYGNVNESTINTWKNTSANTWYFAPDGNDSNDGTSASTPKRNMGGFIAGSSFTAGDTCVLLPRYI